MPKKFATSRPAPLELDVIKEPVISSEDQHLLSLVPDEIVEYLCVEYNGGNYSPRLVKAFLFSNTFQNEVVKHARKKQRPDYHDLALLMVSEHESEYIQSPGLIEFETKANLARRVAI